MESNKINVKANEPTLSNTWDNFAPLPLENVGIDWLSLSFTGEPEKNTFFDVEVVNRQTPIFKKCCLYKHLGKLIFTCIYEPRMKIIRKNAIIIKIENIWLYNEKLNFYLEKLLGEHNLIYSHIVRCDLYTDFQRINKYSDPVKLIENIFSKKIAKLGRCKIQLNSAVSEIVDFQTISFGRYSSRLVYKIYNKTLELKEGKSKDWIKDSWAKNNFEKEKTTWRCEFQISNKNINWVDTSNGENWELDLQTLKNPLKIKETLQSLIEKHLTFRKVENKIGKEYWKPINWTGTTNSEIKILKSDIETDNTISDRIFLKKLVIQYQNFQKEHHPIAENYRVIIEKFVTEKGLFSFYDKLSENINVTLHDENLFELKNKN